MTKPNHFRSFFTAILLAIGFVGFSSCDDDTSVAPEAPTELRGPYDQKGVFILNEGNYGQSNSSISFLSDSADNTVLNNIFSQANAGRPLGDVVTDLDIVDSVAYITVNNSNKIEVVDAYTFETQSVIENLEQPRYFAALNGEKGYVTEWVTFGSPGQVSVIDLKTGAVTKTIPVGPLPEELLLVDDKLYVANSGSNTVTVINTTTDTKVGDITVAASPSELELDRNGNLWVLSSGVKYTAANTAGALNRVNLDNGTVTRTLPFSEPEALADNLTINGEKDLLYYTFNGKTYSHPISSPALASTPFLDRGFYGLGVDPETGSIYGAESNGFAGNGTVYVYAPDGTEKSTFTVGIGPSGFVFK